MKQFVRKSDRQRRYRKGRLAEITATILLICTGYRILARNFRSPAGEIDIIAIRSQNLAFIEVKARNSLQEGLEAISCRQQKRIFRAAEHWLLRFPGFDSKTLSFDAIICPRGKIPRHYKNVFRLL